MDDQLPGEPKAFAKLAALVRGKLQVPVHTKSDAELGTPKGNSLAVEKIRLGGGEKPLFGLQNSISQLEIEPFVSVHTRKTE